MVLTCNITEESEGKACNFVDTLAEYVTSDTWIGIIGRGLCQWMYCNVLI